MKTAVQKYHFRQGTLTTFLNPFSYYILRKSSNSYKVFNKFKIHYDGVSLSAISNILFSETTSRVSFDDTSIAPHIFKSISEKKLKLGIIGSSSQSILKAKAIIEKKHNIQVHRFRDGYYHEDEIEKILCEFNSCDIVITSLGTPRQENFLLELCESGWNGVGFTCGGYFDQLSAANGGNYYPYLINKLDLRWLYRIYKEPKRLWRRYFIYYPIGLFYFLYDKINSRPPFNK